MACVGRARNLINRYLLANTSYRIEKLPRRAKAYASSSIEREDYYPTLVAQIQDMRGELAFIVIGANDGVNSDPLFPVLRRDLAQGIVIEPQPEVFRKLVKSYAGFPGVTCRNVAVHPTETTAPLYYIDVSKARGPIPSHVSGMATFDRAVLETSRPEIGAEFDTVLSTQQVECVPLEAIYEQLGRVPDVLQIDTEGFDYEIIKTIPFDDPPRIVHFETKHLSDSDFSACVETLVEQRYTFVFQRFDATAVLRP